MGRVLASVLISSVVVGLVALGTEAQRRRRRHAAAAPPTPTASFTEMLGGLEWGMTKDQLLAHYEKKIDEQYAEALKQARKARDAMQEDEVRAQIQNARQKLRHSYTEFRRGGTEYAGHFTELEFTRGNGEAVLMQPDENSQNYCFLIEGKFWKFYKAFNAEVFGGRTFEQFAEALQTRFGRAREREGVLRPGERPTRWLEWENESSRARAMHNRFYGFYSIVVEDKAVLARLDELRTHQAGPTKREHSVVDFVTSEEGEDVGTSPDVVDSITGNRRNDPEKQPPQKQH